MDMSGERRIPAPREKVYAALNDPAVLKSCIPGCESLEKEDDTHLKATASVKIGPIAARFSGKVQLLDLDPPNGYRIEGEGQGGVAGFAKGGASVHLTEDGPDATILKYDVKAQVGGKIAQLGARLIDATSKQMSDAFFNRFVEVVSLANPHAAAAATPPIDGAREAAAASAAVAPEEGISPMETAASAPLTSPAPPPATTPVGATFQPPAPPPAISIFSLLPERIYGFPIVAWVGAAIFAVIFILIFGSYVF